MFRFKHAGVAIAIFASAIGLWLASRDAGLENPAKTWSLAEGAENQTTSVRPSLQDTDGANDFSSNARPIVLDPWEGQIVLHRSEHRLAGSEDVRLLRRVVKSSDMRYPIFALERLSYSKDRVLIERETIRERAAFHFLLQPKPLIEEEQLSLELAAFGLELVERVSEVGPYVVRYASAGNDPGIIEAIVRELNRSYHGHWVEHASFDSLRRIARVPNDPRYQSGEQWGLANDGSIPGAIAEIDIEAEEGWDRRVDASGVVVAIVDTGIRYTHEDLADNMWVNEREIPGNGIDDDGNGFVDDRHGMNALFSSKLKEGGDPMDDNGHGTHVAGIVGAVGDNGKGIAGVAWNVQLMGLKFLSEEGSGLDSDAIRCMDYAVRQGADIINNSWGGRGVNRAVEDAVRRARDAGVIVVAAAGNSGMNLDEEAYTPGGIDLPNVVTVGNHDYKNAYHSSSSYGPYTVELAAPGTRVMSTYHLSDTSYRVQTGTSMATPHVSGILSLIRSEWPNESIYVSIERLLQGSTRADGYGGSTRAGMRASLAGAMSIERLAPASPTRVRISARRGVGIVSWSHDWDRPIEGFRIERQLNRGEWERVGSVSASERQFVDENTSPLSNHRYRIVAHGDGGSSLPSRVAVLNEVLKEKARFDITLPANDRDTGYGESVAIDGNTLVVGSPRDDDAGDESGSIYIYERTEGSSWKFRQKAIASDGKSHDFFGASVALEGDTLVVGAAGNDVRGIDAGAAYVFQRDAAGLWRQTAKLHGAETLAHDRFGSSIGLSGNRVAISARDDDSMGVNSGAVYIFERGGKGEWRQDSRLLPPSEEDRQYFGWSVSLLGDRLAVGTKGDGDTGISSGAAYLFFYDNDQWRLRRKLVPGDLGSYDEFGYSIALSESGLLIGAPGFDGRESNEGAVYLYRENGDEWNLSDRFAPNASERDLRFGSRLALRGNRIAIASEGNSETHLFERVSQGNWEEGLSSFGKNLPTLVGQSVALGDRVFSVGNTRSPELQSLFETPSRPVSLRVETNTNGVSLSWSQLGEPGGAFAIERRASGTPSWDFIGIAEEGASRFLDAAAFGNSAWEYRVTAIGGGISESSEVVATPVLPSSRLVNLSARGYHGEGERALIPGFAIKGDGFVKTLIRARGPALLDWGIRDAILNPSLSMRDAEGSEIAANEDWFDDYTLNRMLEAESASGASSIALFASESALIGSYGEGVRTAIVSSPNDEAGFALAEVFEIEEEVLPEARLVNLSARGYVSQGQGVLIGGFTVLGDSPMRLLIRGIGPGLESKGVVQWLEDPRITLFDSEGIALARSDDWQKSGEGATIEALSAEAGAFELAYDSKDAALIAIVPPGLYTVILDPSDGLSGIGLLEIYETR